MTSVYWHIFWKIAQKYLLQFSYLFFFYTKNVFFSKAITWIHCFEPFQHGISFLFEFPYFCSFDQTLEKIEKEIKIYWAFLVLITLLCFCTARLLAIFTVSGLRLIASVLSYKKRLYVRPRNIWTIHVSFLNFFLTQYWYWNIPKIIELKFKIFVDIVSIKVTCMFFRFVIFVVAFSFFSHRIWTDCYFIKNDLCSVTYIT